MRRLPGVEFSWTHTSLCLWPRRQCDWQPDFVCHNVDDASITGEGKHREVEVGKREKLFSDFIAEATRLLVSWVCLLLIRIFSFAGGNRLSSASVDNPEFRARTGARTAGVERAGLRLKLGK
jgi:hypothetical protein